MNDDNFHESKGGGVLAGPWADKANSLHQVTRVAMRHFEHDTQSPAIQPICS